MNSMDYQVMFETIESLKKNWQNDQQPFFCYRKRIVLSFLGILVAKSTYNLILWDVLSPGILLFYYFYIKIQNSNILTQEAKSTLAKGHRI